MARSIEPITFNIDVINQNLILMLHCSVQQVYMIKSIEAYSGRNEVTGGYGRYSIRPISSILKLRYLSLLPRQLKQITTTAAGMLIMWIKAQSYRRPLIFNSLSY